MKKLLLLSVTILLATYASAGLITHTDYTSGATITASGQNNNENAVFNEFNGNIESTNIKDGTITTSDISASAAITHTQMSTLVQSTFTYLNTLGAYRRPVLKYISATSVDVENNTGTSNQTCIQFPDERRCVTEDTSSTSVNRRLIITESASFSGTKNSGIHPGHVLNNGQWYAVYAVKVTDVSTDFVLSMSTYAPTQANYSTLNTLMGANSWVYLGMIVYQDTTGNTNTLAKFTQHGNYTVIRSSHATTATQSPVGIRLAHTASATSISWAYASGFTTVTVPLNILIAKIACSAGDGLTSYVISNSAATVDYFKGQTPSANVIIANTVPLDDGLKCTVNTSSAISLSIQGWVDDALGIGYNPQL